MWILDGAITGERLADSRSPQEFAGYSIKEGLYLFFMYYAGGKIQEYLEKRADKKYSKSSGLDARVIENVKLQKAFEDGSVKSDFDPISRSRFLITQQCRWHIFLCADPIGIAVA